MQNEDVDPEEKLAELLLYVAQSLAHEPAAGSMKVSTILFFAEFVHVRKTGKPITGVEYQKLPRGPAPRPLPRARTRLMRAHDAELVDEAHIGHTQHRLVPIRPPRLELFDEDEIKSIDEVVTAYRSCDGASLSSMSHQEPAWDLFEIGDTIAYEAAFLSREPPSEAALAHARRLAEQYSQK